MVLSTVGRILLHFLRHQTTRRVFNVATRAATAELLSVIEGHARRHAAASKARGSSF